MFANGGLGRFAGVSGTVDANLNPKIGVNLGVGGGLAAGGQVCITKAICPFD